MGKLHKWLRITLATAGILGLMVIPTSTFQINGHTRDCYYIASKHQTGYSYVICRVPQRLPDDSPDPDE